MLIYANKRENGEADIIFFFTKRCVTDIQAKKKKKKKKIGRKIFTRFNRRRDKQNVGPEWIPLMHSSVNVVPMKLL